MMKKKILILLGCLILVCLTGGCSGQKDSGEKDTSSSTENQSDKIAVLNNLKQELPTNEEVVLENTDGTRAVLRFTSQVLEDPTMGYLHELECGDTKVTFYEQASMLDSWLFRIDGIWYAALTYDMASADYVTEIFRIEGESMEKIQELEATIESADVEGNKFVMNFIRYVLGTYSTTKTYSFQEGRFETEEEWYTVTIPLSERASIVSSVDLTMILDGQERTVPKGTGMYVMAIADGKVELELEETGERAILEIEIDEEGYVRIDGTMDWDCFVMLPYAG